MDVLTKINLSQILNGSAPVIVELGCGPKKKQN
jgi:hypothetical protein